MTKDPDIARAAEMISSARYLTAFTGAGVSVESGVPPFRGDKGIWNNYDPGILDLSRYRSYPEESWPVVYEIFYRNFSQAHPNKAHLFLSFLEESGRLKSVITQNIDNLHQEAGNREVIEYHGNSQWLACLYCGERFWSGDLNLSVQVPRCPNEGGLLKPDFIFFGETIPVDASMRANVEAERTDLMILIGTTGEVMPAAMVPRRAKNSGASIIEINIEETNYTEQVTDLLLKGRAGEICGMIHREMRR